MRYLWGHRETDELKGCCLSGDLAQERICVCIAWMVSICLVSYSTQYEFTESIARGHVFRFVLIIFGINSTLN